MQSLAFSLSIRIYSHGIAVLNLTASVQYRKAQTDRGIQRLSVNDSSRYDHPRSTWKIPSSERLVRFDRASETFNGKWQTRRRTNGPRSVITVIIIIPRGGLSEQAVTASYETCSAPEAPYRQLKFMRTSLTFVQRRVQRERDTYSQAHNKGAVRRKPSCFFLLFSEYVVIHAREKERIRGEDQRGGSFSDGIGTFLGNRHFGFAERFLEMNRRYCGFQNCLTRVLFFFFLSFLFLLMRLNCF